MITHGQEIPLIQVYSYTLLSYTGTNKKALRNEGLINNKFFYVLGEHLPHLVEE
jgi:hypothetical protein